MTSVVSAQPARRRISFVEKADAYRAEGAIVRPAQSAALVALATQLGHAGRSVEALRAARLAVALDPGSTSLANDAAIAEMIAGDLAAAVRDAQTAGAGARPAPVPVRRISRSRAGSRAEAAPATRR